VVSPLLDKDQWIHDAKDYDGLIVKAAEEMRQLLA